MEKVYKIKINCKMWDLFKFTEIQMISGDDAQYILSHKDKSREAKLLMIKRYSIIEKSYELNKNFLYESMDDDLRKFGALAALGANITEFKTFTYFKAPEYGINECRVEQFSSPNESSFMIIDTEFSDKIEIDWLQDQFADSPIDILEEISLSEYDSLFQK